MNEEASTGFLYDYVARSESLDEYRQILENLADQKVYWSKIMNKIMKENNYTVSEMASLCGVSRQTAGKWLNGVIPKKREMFIKIGFAAHYHLDEMNHFLQRYGCCNKMYPKSLEDSVYIFVLTSDSIEHTYASCQSILELFQMEFSTNKGKDDDTVDETSVVLQSITQLSSLSEMLVFVQKNASIYRSQYFKLYDFVDVFIKKNLLEDFSEEDNVFLLANSQQWSSSLRHCVSEISQKKWYPQRNKIISLGIHLNMNVNQINEMLQLAQMESMCAKNPFENAIIYSLENAELEDVIYCDGTDNLCQYVKRVLKSLEFLNVEFFLEELPCDSVEYDVY